VPKHTSGWDRGISKNAAMPAFRRLSRRAGPVGIVLTAIDLWSKLSPSQKRRLIKATRKHGPAVARAAAKRAASRRPRKGPL
jgi:uncharacterized protein YaaW (UPF0174 family)